MDQQLQEKMNLKIKETFDSIDEIKRIVDSLKDESSNVKSFSFGILIGRLYNSFYYQSRRILKRDPTPEEFLEFVEMMSQQKSKFLEKLES